MKMLVLGGTGGTGQHVVKQALDAGHALTVLARDPAKVAVQHSQLRVEAGDVTDQGALTHAMRGQDVVVSAIGRGLSFKSEHLIQRAVPVMLASMTAAGVARLIFTSALGVGESRRDSPLQAKLFFSTLLRGIYADKLIGDEMIRRSGVDWTIVQPSQMTNGPLTARYRSGERLSLSGMARISRADVAHFILACAADPTTVRKTLIVSN